MRAASLVLARRPRRACGRTAVRASEKEFLADQVMVFDNDPHETAADDHIMTEPRRRGRRPRRRRRRMRLQLSARSISSRLRRRRLLTRARAPRSPTITPRSRPRCSRRSRDGDKGGLTVVHPQVDLGIDLGQHVTLDAGYSADAVSAARPRRSTRSTRCRRRRSSPTSASEGTLALGFQGRRSQHHVLGAVRHRARLPVAPDRRRRVDRPARPQHDGRRSRTATASTRSATRTTAARRRSSAARSIGADPCKKTGPRRGQGHRRA